MVKAYIVYYAMHNLLLQGKIHCITNMNWFVGSKWTGLCSFFRFWRELWQIWTWNSTNYYVGGRTLHNWWENIFIKGSPRCYWLLYHMSIAPIMRRKSIQSDMNYGLRLKWWPIRRFYNSAPFSKGTLRKLQSKYWPYDNRIWCAFKTDKSARKVSPEW